MKRTSRKPFRLSDSLQRHLNAYALAASAAGVGMLALSHPAEAKIVYTPAHQHVPFKRTLSLDLNHDGIVDFKIGRRFIVTGGTSLTHLGIDGRNHNRVAGYTETTSVFSSFYQFTTAFHDGKQIGPPNPFSGGWMVNLWRPRRHCQGPWWFNVKDRYLGLQFQIRGSTHYGWARLSTWCNPDGKKGTGARALLTGYAYETVPNKPIVAGKTKGPDVITLAPGSLGVLAAGASTPR